MANTSKLEFYRFKLNSKNEEFKTFKDFALEELTRRRILSDEIAMQLCFKHLIKCLNEDIAQDNKLKKELALIEKKSVNKYLDYKPTINTDKYIISGVINGGPYGRDKIISDKDDRDSSSSVSRKNSVLQYFYFLLYIPMDHNEGCFIIHSNGYDESITILFRNFISKVFKGHNYNKAVLESFCPKSFQDEYRKGAVLKKLSFKSSFIENTHSQNGIQDIVNAYDIKIEATPKSTGSLNISDAERFKNFIAKMLFGKKNKEKKLDDFEETKMIAENPVTKAQKVFEWNTKDNDFVPVIYLDGRIKKYNEDGTPNFEELGQLCLNYFNDEVLPELRPDLNATKIS